MRSTSETSMKEPLAPPLQLPVQSPPVYRGTAHSPGLVGYDLGAQAARTHCENLTGLEQDLCWAMNYS
jgi:hypothetical protein